MTLSQLQQAVIHLFPTAGPSGGTNWTASVDSSGSATINRWNTALGTEPTATQLTDSYNSSVLLIAQQQQMAILLKSYQAARYGTPVTVTSGNTTLSFPTDTATQTNIMGYLIAFTASTAPSTMPLQDANGTVQQVTYSQLQTLATSIANQSIAAYNKLMSLDAQVSAATTVAAVQAVVWG